jgi:hypothetical protein
MLRSLPVSDPGTLYRVGDGDDCCVEGGPQDRWGMVSYPLYERLKKETPEFEEVTAFQAGRGRMSVRRQGAESTARPLRSEYVTGTYFSTLGVQAFGGRVFTPDDDRPAAPPVAVLSHRAWQTAYGADASVVGCTFIVEGHPLTVIGVAPAGFFGETLESDPPDIWVPVQQEPLIDGQGSLLHQSISAWLRVIGRLRPGASTEGMAPRLTGVLRQWMQNDSGYPANWMEDIVKLLPKQNLAVVPAGAGVAVMKEEYGRSLQILLSVCGLVLLIACSNVANLLLARGADGERLARDWRRHCGAGGGDRSGAIADRACLPQRTFPSDQRHTIADRIVVCLWISAADGNYFRSGSRMARHADRSGGCTARVGPGHQGPFFVRA